LETRTLKHWKTTQIQTKRTSGRLEATKCLVFPKRKAPKNPDDSKPQGIWKYGPGYKPATEDDWDPKEVWIYRWGQQPNDLDDLPKPHGLAPDAEPDDHGNWKVENMWFYAPSENPPNNDDWVL
jgi:hypothetical protein